MTDSCLLGLAALQSTFPASTIRVCSWVNRHCLDFSLFVDLTIAGVFAFLHLHIRLVCLSLHLS